VSDPPTDDFDWSGDPSIVAPEQTQIAVYGSANGGVVIRQERCWNEESDTFVAVRPEYVQAVALAMLRVAKGIAPDQPAPLSMPTAETADNAEGEAQEPPAQRTLELVASAGGGRTQ
jgi:hypothetical protein